MKVLHAVHNFPPEFRGGTERFVEELASAQAEAGHRVVIAAGTQVRAASAAEAARDSWRGLPIVRLRRRARAFFDPGDRFDPGIERLWRGLLRAERPDVVHVHHWIDLTTSLVRSAAEEGFPVVLTLHDLTATCARHFRLRPDGVFCDAPRTLAECAECLAPDWPFPRAELEAALGLRAADFEDELAAAARIVVPSQAHRRIVERLAVVDPTRLVVAPHGCPAGPRRVATPPPAPPPLVLGHWGNLARVKGVALLFEATRRLGAGVPVEWHVWGREVEPGLVRELEAAAAGLRATFHGAYGPEDVAGFGQRLHAAVFPSLCHESYSFAVDEAAALGLPVAVSDRGAPAERVAGFGEVFATGDADALARVLRRWVEEPERLASLRAAVPARWPGVRDGAGRMLELYAEAARAPRPAGPPRLRSLERLEEAERVLDERHREIRRLWEGRKGEKLETS